MVRDKKNKHDLLSQVRAEIIDNNICPDLAKQATNLVMGEGDPGADILFIGEAPGKNEDLSGKPFVGAAGKFLDELLTNIGLRRDDIYITNIVKYRPPNNRDPLPEEKKAFWPYLLRQIEIIQPKLIGTLGRHSMEYFLPDKRIGEIHGQPKRVYLRQVSSLPIVVLPLYHPAAALYNGGLRQTLIEDFNNISQILKLLKESN